MDLKHDTIKALASDSRVKILKSLADRRKMPAELQKQLGLSGSTIIEHLKILEKNSLVKRVETGHKWVYYELTEMGQSLIKPRFATQFVIVLALGVVFAFGGAARFFSSFSSLSAPLAAKANEITQGADVVSTTTTLAEITTTTAPAQGFTTSGEVSVNAAETMLQTTTTLAQTTTTLAKAAVDNAATTMTTTTAKISSAIAPIAPDYLIPVLLGLAAVFLIAGVVGILKGRKTAIENIVVSL